MTWVIEIRIRPHCFYFRSLHGAKQNPLGGSTAIRQMQMESHPPSHHLNRVYFTVFSLVSATGEPFYIKERHKISSPLNDTLVSPFVMTADRPAFHQIQILPCFHFFSKRKEIFFQLSVWYSFFMVCVNLQGAYSPLIHTGQWNYTGVREMRLRAHVLCECQHSLVMSKHTVYRAIAGTVAALSK